MNVGSYLEIYTTMFGWSFYNTLYELFNVTGILYLPFLMALYKNWRDPYLSQDDKSAAVTSQRRMTWGMLSITIVFCLAVLPFKPLALNEVRYTVACTDNAGNKVTKRDVEGGDTGTTYDATLPGNDTRIPILWWLVLSISSGINQAATSSFSCFGDIKGLDQQLRNLTLKDDAIRAEYGRFANECFLPAKSKFMAAMRDGERHDYVVNSLRNFLTNNSEYDATDPYFIGSHFYLETDGFYKEFDKTTACSTTAGGCGFQAEKPVPGWTHVAARDNYSQADLDAGTAGRPYCDEWWSNNVQGLEGKLLGSVEAAKVVSGGLDTSLSIYQNTKNMISDAYTTTLYTDDEIEDMVVQRYVVLDPPEMVGGWGGQSFADLTPSTTAQTAEGFGLAAAGGVAAGVMYTAGSAPASLAAGATALSVANSFAGFYTMMFVLKSAAPMLQAVLLMMIYSLLLIYLVVSEYEVDNVITVLFLMLAVRFFTPLWAMADYLDAQLFTALFPDATWLGSTITHSVERLLLDMVLTVLYVVAPMLLLHLMTMAGQNISRMGDAGMGAADIKNTASKSGGAAKIK